MTKSWDVREEEMRKEKILMGKKERKEGKEIFFLFNHEDRFGRHHLGSRATSLSLEASMAAPNAIHL